MFVKNQCISFSHRLRQFWHTLQELWLRLYSLKVPTAAAINGHGPAAGTLLGIVEENYTH